MGARPGYSDGEWYGRRRGKWLKKWQLEDQAIGRRKWQSEEKAVRRRGKRSGLPD